MENIVGNRGATPLPELEEELSRFRNGGGRIVFTNGCFDLLHPGHVAYLAAARALGDLLVVGLNSDASVRRQGKGAGRPIMGEEERAAVLAALRAVDFVVLFDEDTPLSLIERLKPDVLVKGGDWPLDKIAGRASVEARGGLVVTIPLVEGKSTTSIVERILNSAG